MAQAETQYESLLAERALGSLGHLGYFDHRRPRLGVRLQVLDICSGPLATNSFLFLLSQDALLQC